jgi:collagen type IV alpha
MGVRIQSLSAASWQTLRKVLAGSGRSDAGVGASLLGRRSTPAGPPSVVAPATPEDTERTEVARMPPSFFEQAFDTGPRAQERPRSQPRQTTASFAAAPTPAVGRPLNEPLSGTGGGYVRLDLDDIDEDVTVSSADPSSFSRRPTPAGGWPERPERPEHSMNLMPEPWPRSMTPSGNRTGQGWGQGPASASDLEPGRTPGPVEPPASWRSQSPRAGLEVTAPAGNPALGTTAPMGQPTLSQLVSSTSPTLPATNAVFYDPDNVEPPGRPPDVSVRFAEPKGPLPRPMVPNAFPPPDSGGLVNSEFDVSPRSGSGRIPPAISPEEMALAASAVRGPDGETPLWPGLAEEPPRTSTFKIWAALFLAASGVVGALLWLTPLLTKRASAPPQPVGLVEGPAAATPPESVPPPAAAAAGEGAAAATAETAAAPPAAAPEPAKAPPAARAGAETPEIAAAPPRPRPRVRRRRAPSEMVEDTESPFTDPAARAGTPVAGGIATAPPAAASTGTATAPATVPAEVPAGTATPPVAEPGAEDVYWLSVRSTPTGADVLIDGQVEGKTPFQRRIFDPGRSYALTVRKAGFTSLERSVSGTSEWAKRGNVRTLAVTARLEAVAGGAAETPAATPSPAAPAGASPPAATSPPPTSPPAVSPPPPPASPPASGGRSNPFDEPTAPAPRP